jgi:hypothetical protein
MRSKQMHYPYDSERRLGELNDAQLGDRRFRSYLLRAMREPLELTEAGQAGYRFHLSQALTDVDRRLTRRTLIIANLEESRRGEPGEAA